MTKPFVIAKLCCIRQENVLFSDVSLQLDAGDVLLVEGANGSGKSSLLRLLAGLATPASGDVLWHGQPISECIADYHQQLHYVGHSNGLRLDLTVAESLPNADIDLLTSLQLHNHLHSHTRALSAGQKRKVALAKLFLSHKKLWLLDEPLTALDASTQDFFVAQLQQHLQGGGMAVISSHQPIELQQVSTQVLRLA